MKIISVKEWPGARSFWGLTKRPKGGRPVLCNSVGFVVDGRAMYIYQESRTTSVDT